MTTELQNGDSVSNQTASGASEGANAEKDAIKSHPDYKALEEKYAAAEQELKTQKGRASSSDKSVNELRAELAKYKTLAGVEEETEEETEEKPLTRAELQDQIWELKHSSDIEIYADDEYHKDIESGIPKDYALKNAKLRMQANPDKARLERQKHMATGSASNRELDSDEITEKDRRNMALWGYSEKAILRQKQLKKERGTL